MKRWLVLALLLSVAFAGSAARADEPRVVELRVVGPRVVEPPVVEPRAVEPPAVEPRVVEPPVVEPRAVEPPAVEPRVVEPPVVEPRVVEPPAVEPPVAEPPAVEPPAVEPPAVEPPAVEPRVVGPPPVEPHPVEPRPVEPVRFLIESIRIEGARYSSPRILIAESRLTEGRSYSEAELRDAMSRIKRLPFVLHTDFRLAKGTERGRFVLVIAIEETKPLFIRIDSLHNTIQSNELVQPFDSRNPQFKEMLLHFTNDYYTFGGRWFLGAKGVITGATDRSTCAFDRGRCGSRDPGYSLGYTQYDVFGSRASIAAVVQYREFTMNLPSFIPGNGRRTASFGDHLTYQLTGAVPLFGNNAIRATLSRQREIVNTIHVNYDQGELAWLYDTTDDLLFPARGTFAQAALESHRLLRYVTLTEPIRTTNPWKHDFDSKAVKYWQLGSQQSMSTGGEFATLFANSMTEYHLNAGYAAMLIPRTPALRYGDLRFELSYDRIILHVHAGPNHDTSSRGEGKAGIAYRNAWGIAHLTFEYTGWRHAP